MKSVSSFSRKEDGSLCITNFTVLLILPYIHTRVVLWNMMTPKVSVQDKGGVNGWRELGNTLKNLETSPLQILTYTWQQ